METYRPESVADAVIAGIGRQPDAPPTSRELGAWVDAGSCPAEALEAAARGLGEMGTTYNNIEGVLVVAYGSVNPKALRLRRGRLHLRLEAPTVVIPKTGQRRVRTPG